MKNIIYNCGMSSSSDDGYAQNSVETTVYDFSRNNPFDRRAPIQNVIPQLVESQQFMKNIREFQPPPNTMAIWYFGQNGFMLKYCTGPLIGIDLYLTNSCARKYAHLPYRLDRQLPVFVEPEDLDIDIFITTHSHDDHADPETITRMDKSRAIFVGPFDSCRIYRTCGVEERNIRLVHPGEVLELADFITLQGTFALPTDGEDLNHTGTLLRFPNETTFYCTGDTAYAERLPALLPVDVDVCAICINGGFHNLSPIEAARIVRAVRPRVVVPCHYDMMINNVGSPEMLRVAMNVVGSKAHFRQMKYYEPWLYQRD